MEARELNFEYAPSFLNTKKIQINQLKMPSTSTVAKEKYQAMLEQAKINNAHRKCTTGVAPLGQANALHLDRTNRMVTTRHPSTGGCEVTNSISRRTSHSSTNVPTGRFRAFIKNLISPPAY